MTRFHFVFLEKGAGRQVIKAGNEGAQEKLGPVRKSDRYGVGPLQQQKRS